MSKDPQKERRVCTKLLQFKHSKAIMLPFDVKSKANTDVSVLSGRPTYV